MENVEEKILNQDAFNYDIARIGGLFNKYQKDESANYEQLTIPQIEELFSGSGLIKKIVCKYPASAKTTGYQILNSDGVLVNQNDGIILEGFYNCSIYARLYGYSCLAFNCTQSSPEEPIKVGDNFNSFTISNTSTQLGDFFNINAKNYHFSKVYKFYGDKRFLYQNSLDEISELLSNQSVIQKVYNSFKNLNNSSDSSRFVINNLSYLLVGIKNLTTLGSNEAGQTLINQKMLALNRERGMNKIISYDLEKEDVKFINQSVSGLKEIIDQFKILFASETDYPYEQLFENSQSSGIGSGLQNQLIGRFLWQQRVNEWIETNWGINYELIKNRLFGEEYTVKIPFDIKLNIGEKAELELKVAQRNKTLVEAGIISPQEARFTYHGTEIDLNFNLKDTLLEEEKQIEISSDLDGGNGENPPLDNTANNLGMTIDSGVEIQNDADKELTNEEFDAIANITMEDVLGVLD